MSGDGDEAHGGSRRETHAEAVARAMRENLKKRKARTRALREVAEATPPPTDDVEPGDRRRG